MKGIASREREWAWREVIHRADEDQVHLDAVLEAGRRSPAGRSHEKVTTGREHSRCLDVVIPEREIGSLVKEEPGGGTLVPAVLVLHAFECEGAVDEPPAACLVRVAIIVEESGNLSKRNCWLELCLSFVFENFNSWIASNVDDQHLIPIDVGMFCITMDDRHIVKNFLKNLEEDRRCAFLKLGP